MIDGFEPIRISTNRPVSTEKIHIFSIDDNHYFMPKEIPASFALQALEKMRTEGQVGATAWLLREVFGDAAYDALLACKTIEPAELKQVIGIATKHVLGAVEEIAKN